VNWTVSLEIQSDNSLFSTIILHPSPGLRHQHGVTAERTKAKGRPSQKYFLLGPPIILRLKVLVWDPKSLDSKSANFALHPGGPFSAWQGRREKVLGKGHTR